MRATLTRRWRLRPLPRGRGDARDAMLLTSLVQQLICRMHKQDVTRAEVDDVLVLAPEEGPIFFVLWEVGFQDQDAWDDAAGDE